MNLRFLRSNLYFSGNEFELAQMFNLNSEPIFFPESFNVPSNFNYIGPIPEINHFYSLLDNDLIKNQKEIFVTHLKNLNYKWNFQRELLRYCDEKAQILLNVGILFISDCFEFEIILKLNQKVTNIYENLLNPFGYNVCSLSGYTYKLFKLLYLNNENIFCIQNEFGNNGKKVSKLEYDWSCFQIFEHPEKNFLSAFNNYRGQQFFKESIPDLYSPLTKESLFFNECKIHGHLNCLSNPEANENSKNSFGKTYFELNQEFEEKCCKLIENNNNIDKVTIHWECYFKNVVQKSLTYEKFKKFIFKPHPLYRLRPRTCCRGSYSDVYRLKWSKLEKPNENLYFLDVNGLYSEACCKYPIMIGKYEILMGPQLNDIKFVNNEFYYKQIKMYGTMLVTIIPPKKCFRPFLLYRTKKDKVVNTLCAKCCEFKKPRMKCPHSDIERAITSSYFISELNVALKYNYKILYIHECHFYKEANFFLKDFVKKINALKVNFSNIFQFCTSKSEKQTYCNFLNKEMELKEPFKISIESSINNKRKRLLYKTMANGFFGKFQENKTKPQTRFVRSQNNLEDIYFSNYEITDLFCVNDNFCKVQIVPKDEQKINPSLKNNCYIGGQIIAYSREIIYEHLNTIEANGGTLYQVECDSIIFSLPSQQKLPLCVSHVLGQFKNEINGDILSFYSFGPKNYSITYKNTINGSIETITKVSGISLNNVMFKDELNEKLFSEYLQNLNSLQQKTISQVRTKENKKTNEIVSILGKVTYSNQVTSRRILQRKSPDLVLFPYGFE